MGLFKKKNKNLKFSTYNQNKISKNSTAMTAYDRIDYILIKQNSDEELFQVCDKILDGHPVLVKFEELDITDANRMLSFLSGVIYATYGKIIKVENKLFLMGRKEEFEDGSLLQYVEDYK